MSTWSTYCDDIGISKRHANRLLGEYFEDPFLYNIWNMPRGDDEDYFGHFPIRFMRNLLHYHTDPGDLIYDPFAGSGEVSAITSDLASLPFLTKSDLAAAGYVTKYVLCLKSLSNLFCQFLGLLIGFLLS